MEISKITVQDFLLQRVLVFGGGLEVDRVPPFLRVLTLSGKRSNFSVVSVKQVLHAEHRHLLQVGRSCFRTRLASLLGRGGASSDGFSTRDHAMKSTVFLVRPFIAELISQSLLLELFIRFVTNETGSTWAVHGSSAADD